ncbi:hypothetical protein BGZ57DRAFT_908673 [Hyaloscypha finlandica]|nr:hypothetical protein BGZ57DRAFT_908673 [Hyaloscypha finlandica]
MPNTDLEPAENPKVPDSSKTNLRVVLLVSSPLNESLDGVISRLGAKIKRKTPLLSNWDPVSPPCLSENLCFARHMAICIIPLNMWADKSLQYRDKFKHGRYWAHLGSTSISKKPRNGVDGAGEQWSNETIESIEAVENLGTIDLSDNEITEGSKNIKP